jgi:class 3 adenylate cyclase
MREVTTLFASVVGVDLGGPLGHSQRCFACVQRAVYAYGGSVNKLLVDDKGTLVVAIFGLPPTVHPDAPSRAVAAAFLLLELLHGLNHAEAAPTSAADAAPRALAASLAWRLSTGGGDAQAAKAGASRLRVTARIGITTARTFCGVIGSKDRREFTVMGDSVNLAARLMASCGLVRLDPQGDHP